MKAAGTLGGSILENPFINKGEVKEEVVATKAKKTTTTKKTTTKKSTKKGSDM